MKKQLLVWLFACLSSVAWAQDVDEALAQFDQHPDAKAANDFFDALLEDEEVKYIMDNMVVTPKE